MANTLELGNADGVNVLVQWVYDTFTNGASDDMMAYVILESEFSEISGGWTALGTTLGFDEVKTATLPPDTFVPGELIVLFASNGVDINRLVAGPTAWPQIVPDEPVDQELSDWSNVIELLAGIANLPVMNLTGTTTATHWNLSWDKYTSFVPDDYLVQWKPAESDVWSQLAIVAATDDARQTYAFQHAGVEGIAELDPFNFRVRARRGYGE